MIFQPATLARGWRSVALAGSKDAARPILTGIYVEQYATGFRLVATDSYMLLHTFVPTLEAERDFEPEPSIDEAPLASCVVADPDGRGLGLLAYAQKLATKDAPELDEISVDLGVIAQEDEDAPAFAGMEARWCVITISERERVKLRLIEGEYPNWRGLLLGLDAEETKQVGLHLDRLATLAKLKKTAGESVLGWSFQGENKPARVELVNSFPHISGLVMPCQWNVYDNEPVPEKAKDDDEIDGQEAIDERPGLRVVPSEGGDA